MYLSVMCGLSGFFASAGHVAPEEARAHLESMGSAIAHRGPDADGLEVVQSEGSFVYGVGHRRLSIIDLSPAGAQPMISHDGRYVIAFNGEIYNFLELRQILDKRHRNISWRGHSDTEVLLELIADVGINQALGELDGMFALAVFDRHECELTLARDPFGEKPLYYGFWQGFFLFASELNALQAWPGFTPKQSLPALASYFKYGYVPTPATVFENVYKLPAAHCLSLGLSDLSAERLPKPYSYWDMVGAAHSARELGFDGSAEDAALLVHQVLVQSTKRRTVADVPLGCLLSGGIDSSLTTAMMQQASTTKVHTFTIGMDEPGYNEADHARAVSQHLGTYHTEMILTPAEVQEVIPAIAGYWDEPFADSSQVPTYLVAKLARQHVSVVLSGDGGDELFAGYNRYFHAPQIWSRIGCMPGPVRRVLAGAMGSISTTRWNQLVHTTGRWAPPELAGGRAGEKIHKLARLLSAENVAAYHDQLLAIGKPGRVLREMPVVTDLTFRLEPHAKTLPFAERAMLLDTANFLTDDVLTKVDRASMAVSLETRTPFLNRELFELAWRLPMNLKTSSTMGKLVLRNVLEEHVPRKIFNRPKAGFAIPVGRWLRGPLREWAESELSTAALERPGFFDAKAVRHLWEDHISGRSDNESALWAVLMYQGWVRNQSISRSMI